MGRQDDMTLAELTRSLARLEASVSKGFGDMQARIISLNYVPKDVYEAEKVAMETRVSRLETTKDWFIRTLGAAGFVGLLGILLSQVRLGS